MWFVRGTYPKAVLAEQHACDWYSLQDEAEVIAVGEATSCVERKADGRARSALRRSVGRENADEKRRRRDRCRHVGFAHLMVVVQVANLAGLDGGERRERHGGAESLGWHRAIGTEGRSVRASCQPAHETIDRVTGTATLLFSQKVSEKTVHRRWRAPKETRADHMCDLKPSR